MKSLTLRLLVAGMVLVALSWVVAGDASAQCSTCPVSTVAYQPAVAQPTVAYQPYTGWYPGKWLDQWRLRRAGVTATAPAYSAAYAPSYTAAYAPSYTAAYAPSYTAYTSAYRRPYVTAYAPLSYAAAAPCNTCTQTVARQVLLRPVVAAPVCNTCDYTPSCGCDAGVSQATYTEPYGAPGCSGCDGGGSVSSNPLPSTHSHDSGNYDSGNHGNSGSYGQQTRQPDFSPVVPALEKSRYDSRRPLGESKTQEGDTEADVEKTFDDPRPETDVDSSTYYYNAPRLNAPRLLDPSDRTARNVKTRSYKQTHKPTVDVWTAVYRGPAKHRNVSTISSRRPTRTQAEIDADGWTAVRRNR